MVKPRRKKSRSKKSDTGISLLEVERAKRERYFEIFLAAILLAFGVYLSVLYFGHKIVPNSDFPAFHRVGRELWSLRLPSKYKWAPGVGLLQVVMSWVAKGPYPDLAGGWLLNAVLFPFNLLLFWLIAKRIIGKSAIWFAVVVIINPWLINLLTEPIAETTLIFFVLLTFYFMLKRSSWCYLFASITTMVRYEGAALIMAAFVMDMVLGQNRRQRVKALGYTVLAVVPLAVWMIGTVCSWQADTTHYFYELFSRKYAKEGIGATEGRTGLVMHMKILWQVGFRPMLFAPIGSGKEAGLMLWKLRKVIVCAGFFFGCIYGLIKRNWQILVIFLFFVPYFVLHAYYPHPLQRFHAPVFWIAVLMFWFGMVSVWRIIENKFRPPKAVVIILQCLVAVGVLAWFINLVRFLPKAAAVSPTSASVPYVAMALVGLVAAGKWWVCRTKNPTPQIAAAAVLFLIIVSNQFFLVRLVGDGQSDKEFKQLAEWFVANAKPEDKLAVYMSGTTRIFAGEYADRIVGYPMAENPPALVRACYEEGITYVVWATREGLSRDHPDYRRIKLDKNIALLRHPKDMGPFWFVTQLGSKRGYVNVFRLIRPIRLEQKP